MLNCHPHPLPVVLKMTADTTRISIIWKLVRNVTSGPPLLNLRLGGEAQQVCGDWCNSKFKNLKKSQELLEMFFVPSLSYSVLDQS